MRSLPWMLALCAAFAGCAKPTGRFACEDGLQSAGESDVDCGGAVCGPCAAGQRCRVATDCAGGACLGGACLAPSCADGVLGAGESDLDCGGACAPCLAGFACAVDGDCASGVCASSLCAAPTCAD